MSWSDAPIHIIDFEGSPRSGVLEYGIVTLHNDSITQTLTRLCAPISEIPHNESLKHYIYAKDTTGAAPFSDEWDLFSSLRQSGPLCAHHASVENAFLKSTWPHPPQSPDFFSSDNTINTWGPWIDSCQIYKSLFPQLTTYKLMDLISTFRLSHKLSILVNEFTPPERQKPHCALYDALASALLIMNIATYPQFKDKSLPWLLATSATNNNSRQQFRQLPFQL